MDPLLKPREVVMGTVKRIICLANSKLSYVNFGEPHNDACYKLVAVIVERGT